MCHTYELILICLDGNIFVKDFFKMSQMILNIYVRDYWERILTIFWLLIYLFKIEFFRMYHNSFNVLSKQLLIFNTMFRLTVFNARRGKLLFEYWSILHSTTIGILYRRKCRRLDKVWIVICTWAYIQ